MYIIWLFFETLLWLVIYTVPFHLFVTRFNKLFFLYNFYFKEEFKALSLVSRDLRPVAPVPMTAQFIIEHKQLGFMLTDELANITLFNYLPETKESIGGERLIIRAILNIGSLINSIVRVKGNNFCYFISSFN